MQGLRRNTTSIGATWSWFSAPNYREPTRVSHIVLLPKCNANLTCKVYEEVKDSENLQAIVEEYLGEYNADSKQPMNLVMFGDAIDHVARISRVIRYLTTTAYPVQSSTVFNFANSSPTPLLKDSCNHAL